MIAFGVRKTATVTHRSRTATVMVYVPEITSDSTTRTNDFHHNPIGKLRVDVYVDLDSCTNGDRTTQQYGTGNGVQITHSAWSLSANSWSLPTVCLECAAISSCSASMILAVR